MRFYIYYLTDIYANLNISKYNVQIETQIENSFTCEVS